MPITDEQKENLAKAISLYHLYYLHSGGEGSNAHIAQLTQGGGRYIVEYQAAIYDMRTILVVLLNDRRFCDNYMPNQLESHKDRLDSPSFLRVNSARLPVHNENVCWENLSEATKFVSIKSNHMVKVRLMFDDFKAKLQNNFSDITHDLLAQHAQKYMLLGGNFQISSLAGIARSALDTLNEIEFEEAIAKDKENTLMLQIGQLQPTDPKKCCVIF